MSRIATLLRDLAHNQLVALVLTRVAVAIPLLIGVSLLTFTILQFTAGDQITALLGDRATDPAKVAALRAELGLDQPFHVQYGRYFKRLVIDFDLGHSWARPENVSDALRDRFPATLELTLAAMCVSLSLGLVAGVISALRRNSLIDYAAMATALFGVSIPVFWLGLMMAYVFGVWLGWLPIAHRLPVGLAAMEPITGMHLIDGVLRGRWDVVAGALRHLVLPAVTVGAISAALIARITRASMIESGSQDFVRTARAKGLGSARTTYHTFRHALIPIVTVIGLQFGTLLGGAIITETIFSWPGLGKYLVDAILQRDGNAVQGAVLLITFTFVVINLVVDLLYGFLDPRIHHGAKA
jgi:peptide/nickel transport system permease protein